MVIKLHTSLAQGGSVPVGFYCYVLTLEAMYRSNLQRCKGVMLLLAKVDFSITIIFIVRSQYRFTKYLSKLL